MPLENQQLRGGVFLLELQQMRRGAVRFPIATHRALSLLAKAGWRKRLVASVAEAPVLT